ncbi:PAS domain S-box protein [Cytophagaceae bacterium 50C-KIRBA]|uniref:histidine kinase n=1 Tax=Aquirufa beregesia TaxID=2516556 RepID=A0ABX0EYY1_9BACT|nr:PAS domain S-box protein [Aquirufa beregesia]NGZ42855.1 PAS domain S-box protein [Aquirufa beregesia]
MLPIVLPIPQNEEERLTALLQYNILDTISEEEFDDLTQLASSICQVPIALISLIDKDRQWFKSKIGLTIEETSRGISFCQYTIMGDSVFEVQNTLQDNRFIDNPFVTGQDEIRFYAGAPLLNPDGYAIGSICVLDRVPRQLTEEQKKSLQTLSKQVINQLELRQKNIQLKDEIASLAKDALEVLTKELNSYKLALDQTSCVIITDEHGIIKFVNDTTCKVTKFSKEELVGQHNRILNSGYHNSAYFADMWQTVQNGSIWKGEIKNKAKDGSLFWADLTIVPIYDEQGKASKFLAIKSDITRQKQDEDQLKQYFDLSKDLLCIANVNGYFERLSPSFSEILGYSNEELMAKPFYDFIVTEDILSTQKIISSLAEGKEVVNFEARFTCKTGGHRILSWNASLNKESGLLFATARDITEIKSRTEENKRLSFVARATDNMVVITDKTERIQWVNEPFEKITGYTFEESFDKKPAELVQYIGTSLETKKAIREALDHHKPFRGEIQNISKSGKEYWVDLYISPIYNDKGDLINYIAIESDITEKKEKDNNIANLLATQKAIFYGVGLCVIFTDTQGIIQNINQAALNLLEYKSGDLIGKSTPALFHDPEEIKKRTKDLSLELGIDLKTSFDTFVLKARSTGVADANEWTYISKSGKRIPVWLSVTCIRHINGEILGYLGVAEDYTLKKQVENELIQAKTLAEQAVFAKDSFLANMSHEIRTPLNAVIGFTELLTQSELSTDQKEYVDHIQTAGENLLVIINEILDLSKIDSGQLHIEEHPFNVRNTLKHVYELLKVKAHKNKLDFSLFLDAEIPDSIIGDKVRINQIIMNLAGNAIKFTEEGEVLISVKKTAETDTTVTLRFSVKDTGIGIAETKLDSIFERFRQAEESTTRKFGGTGLGLNIAKQMVELQHGKLEVKSKLGQGSEFYFSLEFKKTTDSNNELSNQNSKVNNELGKLSILLCEDNELNQRLAKTVIQNFGFDIDIAANGQLGIEKLTKKKYDLILMDLQMPIQDGYQTTIMIRNELKMNIPIIAMTAHSLVGEQQKCFDIGMNAYVAKPFKQYELLEAIQDVIKKSNLLGTESETTSSINPIEDKIIAIDFSYLDELSGGDDDFKKEMMELFIKNVPEDVIELSQAIQEKNQVQIKKSAHRMKSSLAMFQLSKGIQFLESAEQQSLSETMDPILPKTLPDFQTYIQSVIFSLKLLL